MVLVYSDDDAISFEMLGKASGLAKETGEKVNALIIGPNDDNVVKQYFSHGADKVISVESGLDNFKAEEYSELFEKTLDDTKDKLILIGSNKNGKELASRLAGRIKAGCIIDATDVYLKDKKLFAERVVYSGNAIAVEEFKSDFKVITIPSKVFDPLPADSSRSGEHVKKKFEIGESQSNIVKVEKMQTGDVNVEEAEVIVSCGRGFKNKDDIKLVEGLANALKGKTVGCSRPIAADLKWLSEDHWIGLSGHKVKPKLYVAAGISGQIQHIAGMRDSKVIVAINKDPEALIFKSADYGIVGDLYDIIPKLTEAVKAKIG